jgi:GT2 family glycosyltransferase
MSRDGQAVPFVSIVIPTRDRAPLLADALGSVVAQDYPADRYEVIVVDDGSKDETPRTALETSRSGGGPAVRLVRQPPRNANTARNLGVRQARGSLVAFFDDDQLAPNGWLSALVDAASRHPDADCVGGPCRVRFESRPPRLCPRCLPWQEGGFDKGDRERTVDEVQGGNMMIRREAFEEVGMFDEDLSAYGDETEWMVRMRKGGGRVVYAPSSWIWHRRTRERLRLSMRLREAYSSGAREVRFLARVGRGIEGGRRLAHVPRLLGHAARHGCSGGLTRAAHDLGFVREAWWPPPPS